MDRWPKELMPMVPGGGEDDNGARVIQVPENDNPADELEAELYKIMEASSEEEAETVKTKKTKRK